MFKHRFYVFSTMVASVFFVAQTANAGYILIDDFSTGSQFVADPDLLGADEFDSAAGATILGGNRDILVTNNTNSTGASVTVQVLTGSGLSLYSEPDTEDGMAEIIWDGSDATAANDNAAGSGLSTGGDFDLTDGGTNKGIVLYGVKADHPTELTLSIWSDTGEVSTANVVINGFMGMTPTNIFVSFLSLVGNVDLTAVTSIGLFIDASSSDVGTDVTISGIAAVVPEPTSMAIMGLGTLLAGFGVRRRKQKQAQLAA